MTPDSGEPLYYVENVELVPPRRRTIKLLQNRGGGLLGFASWGLSEQEGKTTVTYDVYAEVSPSTETLADLTATEREAFEMQSRTAQDARFRQELLDLKRLLEREDGEAPN